MTDGDDKLLRHYRLLPRDEPSHALDTAILAASRRAVASRPWSKRLAGPVSIAAVLVLAVGVTLNMQREQPGVEMPAEAQYKVEPSQAPTAPVTDSAAKDSFARKPAEVAAPAPAKPQAKPELRALKKEAAAPAAAPSTANEASVMRDAQVAAAAPPVPDPAAELERIAKLRSDGRAEEADKALSEFFRKHPDYKIPDPVWDRVKPR